jgi:hypothetical protein
MGTAATDSDVAAGVEGVLGSVKALRRECEVTHGVDVALEGAEICLMEALARVPSGEVVNEAEQ